ncbi:MAG: 4-hydroxyphenylpyruvate dioxygenase [Sandaracinaceae bacterium]
MSQVESLRIKRLEALHYYVHDLARSRRFYTERFDFAEVGASDATLTEQGKQRSAVFEAGEVRVVVSEPVGEGGRAARWLKRHPDGVGTLVFEVEDIDHTFRLLDARGGTPLSDVVTLHDDHGVFRTFSITTPFGGATFRFVQRDRYAGLYPGIPRAARPSGGHNRFGFGHVDHVTSNFETMAPALLWMQHVMGFERFWGIEFHTEDVRKEAPGPGHVGAPSTHGSGLRSAVMWDPHSGVKFANNEPLRPFFKASQINLFYEDNAGDGIQHVALTVKDIVTAVRQLRDNGVEFMPTPGTYYDALPERLQRIGVQRIDEDIATLRELEILVDGEKEHAYMLQIFLKDSAGLYREPKAGPFFYEIIQRKGDRGFGGGNFRALFESIERQQRSEGRVG